MKIAIGATKLNSSLSVTGGVIPTKGIVPVIQNYKFSIEGKKLSITGSNLDVFISQSIELSESDIEKFDICLDAQALSELIKTLKGKDIAIEFEVIKEEKEDRYEAKVVSAVGTYVIPAESAKFYPSMAEKSEINYDLEAGYIMDAVSRASIAAKNQGKVHDHLLIEMGNGINVLATDANILILKSVTRATVNNEKILIPRTSSDMLTSMPFGDIVNMSYTREQVFFDFNNGTCFACRRMTGEKQYPDISKFIPDSFVCKATVNVDDFKDAIRRSVIFANKITNEIQFDFTVDGVSLTAVDLDFGKSSSEFFACNVEGNGMEIVLNGKILIELLNQIKTDESEIWLNGKHMPACFYEKDVPSTEFFSLIMPIYVRK